MQTAINWEIHTHTHTHTRTHTHTQTTNTHIHIHTRTHAHTNHKRARARAHTHPHPHPHTHTHTHTHTDRYTQKKKFYTSLRCVGGWSSCANSWLWCCREAFHFWFITLPTFVCRPHYYGSSIVIFTCTIRTATDILSTNNMICVVPKLNGILHWTTTCVKWFPMNMKSAVTSSLIVILEKIMNFNFSWND